MRVRPPAPSRSLEGTLWRLRSALDADGSGRRPPGDEKVTARFVDGIVSGSGGCNRYSGDCTISGRSLAFGPLASTMRACPEPAMSIETAFLAALGRATAWDADGRILVLRDADGASLLEFTAVDEPSLTSTAWGATGVNDGRGGVRSLVAGTSISATFDEDGSVSGSSGCNRYRGRYRTDGAAIAIGPLATTRMACPRPEMDQEAAYLAALERATTFRIDGDTLELRGDGEALQVAFEVRR